MNPAAYETEIRTLIDDIQAHLRQPSPHLFSLIAQLENRALEKDDTALLGYCSFCRACAHYFSGSHPAFFRHLKQAVYHLLRSDDRETLARSFNLFAVEAQRLGCFDVAYHYFNAGYSFVADAPASFVRAILDANIGDLLTEMGDAKKACVHIRRTIPALKRNKEDASALSKIFLETTNLGMHHLYAGELQNARRIRTRLAQYLAEQEAAPSERERHFYLLFCAYMALVEEDRALCAELTGELMDQLSVFFGAGEFIKDLCRFCSKLVEKREWTLAGRLLTALTDVTPSRTSAYARKLLSRLQIEYYRATGNRNRLLQAHATLHQLIREQIDDEKTVRYESMMLIRLIYELRAEQAQAELENDRLRVIAQTDALTRLPNRHALNDEMEAACARAQEQKTSLGIGIIDIDAFKQYNDKKGHRAGDRCLCDVAAALSGLAKKESLFCARYGGDEFVLIYEGKTDAQIKRLEKEMEQLLPVPATHGFFNAVPEDDTRLWTFFSNADKRLYRKKRAKQT